MERVFLLVGFVAALQPIQFDSCVDIASSFRNCCTYFEAKIEDEILINECAQELGDVHLCDYVWCIGEKKGFITVNKTFDRAVSEKLLLEGFKNNTQIIDIINEKCLGGDINSYIQEDYCYLLEISRCVVFQTMMKCDKWIDSDECKNIKRTMRECEKIIS